MPGQGRVSTIDDLWIMEIRGYRLRVFLGGVQWYRFKVGRLREWRSGSIPGGVGGFGYWGVTLVWVV